MEPLQTRLYLVHVRGLGRDVTPYMLSESLG